MFSHLPAEPGKPVAGKRHRIRFQRRCHGVVPSIEESEQRNDAHDLHDLAITEMRFEGFELGVGGAVWHLSGSERQSHAASKTYWPALISATSG